MRSRPRFLFEGEEVILNTRLHLRALLKPITVGAALVALAAAARWLYPGSPLDGLQIPEALLSLLLPERLGVRNFVRPDLWPYAAGGVLVLYALYLLTRIVRWRRHRVVVTTHRLIETSGVFGRRVSFRGAREHLRSPLQALDPGPIVWLRSSRRECSWKEALDRPPPPSPSRRRGHCRSPHAVFTRSQR